MPFPPWGGEKAGNLRKPYTEFRQWGEQEAESLFSVCWKKGWEVLYPRTKVTTAAVLLCVQGKDLFCGLLESMVEKAFHKMVFTVFGKIHPFARWIRSNIFSRSVHMF